MALKMAGYASSVNTFSQYYETHLHKKVVKDKRTKVEMVVHYGSYNFVPKKMKGTVQIVLAYWNKWRVGPIIGSITARALMKMSLKL